MRFHVIVAGLLVLGGILASLVSPLPTSAANYSSFCKWPQPWPATVSYYVAEGDFGLDGATRVQYGANTWTEANFNLILTRTNDYTSRNSVKKDNLYDTSKVAVSVTSSDVGTNSSLCRTSPPGSEGYWAIYYINTFFNTQVNFSTDCKAAGGTWCADHHYFDYHDIATHEFGHWFKLFDTSDPADSADSMYYLVSYGETNKRDLTSHDHSQGWIMYGCRNGKNNANCS